MFEKLPDHIVLSGIFSNFLTVKDLITLQFVSRGLYRYSQLAALAILIDEQLLPDVLEAINKYRNESSAKVKYDFLGSGRLPRPETVANAASTKSDRDHQIDANITFNMRNGRMFHEIIESYSISYSSNSTLMDIDHLEAEICPSFPIFPWKESYLYYLTLYMRPKVIIIGGNQHPRRVDVL